MTIKTDESKQIYNAYKFNNFWTTSQFDFIIMYKLYTRHTEMDSSLVKLTEATVQFNPFHYWEN